MKLVLKALNKSDSTICIAKIWSDSIDFKQNADVKTKNRLFKKYSNFNSYFFVKFWSKYKFLRPHQIHWLLQIIPYFREHSHFNRDIIAIYHEKLILLLLFANAKINKYQPTPISIRRHSFQNLQRSTMKYTHSTEMCALSRRRLMH